MAFGIKQLQTQECGLHHLHRNCVISGKFPNLSEPSCQHPHTQGLPED